MDKTIGVCGFISTGSSAVSDLLKEFDENIVLDKLEFEISFIPDGLEDLAYHLHEGSSKILSSYIAIERFKKLCDSALLNKLERSTNYKFRSLTKKYLEDIIQLEYYGKLGTDYKYPYLSKNRVTRKLTNYLVKMVVKLEKRFHKQIYFYPAHKIYFSSFPENFYNITRKYIDEILVSMGKRENKNIVLDQPFAGNNPVKSFNFFNNPKAIVVDRDPRDHYLFSKVFLRSKGISYVPTNRVEDYVIYYRESRKGMPYLQPNQDILNIRFEDMIYEYDKSIQEIINFLDLKKHSRPKSIFDPLLSISNTQIFKVYSEYRNDIEYIEKELPDYLYPFENYKGVKIHQGKMFSGKSPLNKSL
ncbi:sulfotransferase domain-containing protein [Treponema primitia]|uniref:sulfotransferase domain-containing protein n=1 Tax=Treponema primitia TaxID=88058 RepID=UPI0002554EDE|nr:sulfotransferase domain-containing protein [Treponema primitia]